MNFTKLSKLPLRHDFELEPIEVETDDPNYKFLTNMFSVQTDSHEPCNGVWIDKDTEEWYLVREPGGSYKRLKASALKDVVELF